MFLRDYPIQVIEMSVIPVNYLLNAVICRSLNALFFFPSLLEISEMDSLSRRNIHEFRISRQGVIIPWGYMQRRLRSRQHLCVSWSYQLR